MVNSEESEASGEDEDEKFINLKDLPDLDNDGNMRIKSLNSPAPELMN